MKTRRRKRRKMKNRWTTRKEILMNFEVSKMRRGTKEE